MGWTKLQFITTAYEEIGYADYVFDVEPEQLQSALFRLDSMMASWDGIGIRVGYPLSDNPLDSNLETVTSVPDFANSAIYLNLAIMIAPTVGKMVSADTKAGAKSAYDTLVKRAALPRPMQFPTTLPAGAGNKPWRNSEDPFIKARREVLEAGTDSNIDFK